MVLEQFYLGISSGVFCVIFGIYEELVDSILHFFNNCKRNLSFLLPIILGIFVGIILFGNILKFLFNMFHMQTCFCIIGFIIGGIPCLLKQHTKKLNLTSIIILLFTLFLTLYLITLESLSYSTDYTVSYANLIISGIFMSAGIVIPGVSSTAILMLLGSYNIYLNAISTINITILFPIGIGAIIGGLIFLKIIQFLLKHFTQYTYYGIAGFTLGSIFIIFPGFNFKLEGFVSIALFFIGLYLSNKMSLIKK